MGIAVSKLEYDEAKAFEKIVEQKGSLGWNSIDNCWYYIPYRNAARMTYSLDPNPIKAVFKASWKDEKPPSMATNMEC